MKKLILMSSMAMLLATAAQALNSPIFPPGKIAVLRGGDGSTNFTLAKQRRFPAYADVFDPAVSNSTPVMTYAFPTNGINSIWFNLHGGSEGIGLTRSEDRQFLVFDGYHGDLTNTTATPSSATDCTRGFGTVDAFTNFNVKFQSQEWFGLQPGITQNNPRGMATDGTNSFWGSGTVAGTQTGGFAESGTLFWNSSVSPDPEEVQNLCESGYGLRIIGGSLYMDAKNEAGGAVNNGIFNFVDINNNPVPLPWAPGQEQVTVFTNLFLDFGTYKGNAVASVLTFDMNASNTIAYAADQTFGIMKYVNTDGAWSLAYAYDATNLGTLGQINTNNQGCFGIAVDFSGTNPVIYATTAESGDGSETAAKGGNVSSNRLISIVDSGDPGTNMVATTLAVANGANEGFRSLDFTPDLRPQIQTQPVPINTSTNVPSSFNVVVASIYPVTYQWQIGGVNVTNSSNISGANTATLSFAHSDLTNQGNYTVVITNTYGAVTSSVVSMTVAAITLPPSYTKALLHLTNFIGDNVNITASPIGGTPAFTYQWYFGATQLSDGPNGHGSGYQGSQTASTLAITNVQQSDSGNYFIAVTNSVGGTNVEVATLTVVVRPPFIGSGGQPQPLVMLTGQTGSLTVSALVGTQPLTFQWYQGKTNPVTQLSNGDQFNNVTTSSLSIGPAITTDATNYFCVIANSAGSITSQVASVTVIVPPAPSFLGYSNQVYTQNFDSLPNPGEGPTVNTVSAGTHEVTIGGITYSLSNPFDFALPVYFPSGNVDGLGLSNTMAGWYGECDLDTVGCQLGASCGDQTTGGIISFGDTNTVLISDNRALGLIATGTSGNTHFGLKLINETGNNLNYINLSFLGEYWKLGTTAKVLSFSYLVDSQGTNSTFSTSEINASLNNNVGGLAVSYPAGGGTGKADGELPQNQTNLSTTNFAISTPWTPGAALWLVWSITNSGSGGQGYGIDNLSFSASQVPIYAPGKLGNTSYTGSGGNKGLTFSFTSTPGASGSFTVWSSTNLTLPFGQWKDLGNPTEAPAGTYGITDPSAVTNPATFYQVTSP